MDKPQTIFLIIYAILALVGLMVTGIGRGGNEDSSPSTL